MPESVIMSLPQFLEAVPEAMFATDASGAVVCANAQIQELLGYSASEMLGASIETFMPERYRAAHQKDRAHFSAGSQTRTMAMAAGLKLYALHRNGTEIPVEISLHPIATAHGPMTVGAMRDLTAHQQAEQRLQQLVDNLQATHGELESFTYSVAHDLRAPLRHIQGFVEALNEELPAPNSSTIASNRNNILLSTRHMSQMIDGLLNLARFTNKNAHPQRVSIHTLVTKVLAELQHELAGREIVWRIGDLPTLDCDPGLTHEILSNLLSNAIKFTRLCPQAVIEVGSVPDAGQTALYVRDNGVGFDMKYASKLFGMFQRLHRSEDFEGTGVGLAIVQRIVRHHGGRIWAKAAPQQGATFYFTLAPSQAS